MVAPSDFNKFPEEDPFRRSRSIASETISTGFNRHKGFHLYPYIKTLTANPDLGKFIMWTDEESFTRDGFFNVHNNLYYALENPHVVHERCHQQQFLVVVGQFCGLLGYRTPTRFFLWGHVKSLVYRTPVANEAELINRITAAFATGTPAMLELIQGNIVRHARLCIEVHGQHFENLL
ncbi:hypothetical protein ABEB36_000286 [Hypothenemus hampei]|uniref:Uncharacterized protein n=1 Tax=Hypothenemus hampei TaxID=57062 RepID=A0ABD1FAS6_HYPHA